MNNLKCEAKVIIVSWLKLRTGTQFLKHKVDTQPELLIWAGKKPLYALQIEAPGEIFIFHGAIGKLIVYNIDSNIDIYQYLYIDIYKYC